MPNPLLKGLLWIIGGFLAFALTVNVVSLILIRTQSNSYEHYSFTTEYGDSFQLTRHQQKLHDCKQVSLFLKQKRLLKKTVIYTQSVADETDKDGYAQLLNLSLSDASQIVCAYSDGEARIYQFPLYYVYTLDDGKTFHGIKIGEKIEDKEVLRLIDHLQPYG